MSKKDLAGSMKNDKNERLQVQKMGEKSHQF